MHAEVCICVYIYVCMPVWVCMCVCVCLCVYLPIWVYVWSSVSVCLWSSVVICVRYMWDAYVYSCTCLNVHVYVWSLDFVSYLIINLFYPTFWDRLESGFLPEPEVHWLSRPVGDPSVSRLPSLGSQVQVANLICIFVIVCMCGVGNKTQVLVFASKYLLTESPPRPPTPSFNVDLRQSCESVEKSLCRT